MRDKERGVVWEEVMILLPHKVRYVFLSATIPNALEFAQWIAALHGQPCHVVYTECAACRSKWAGAARAIDTQLANAQKAWSLGVHALRVAGVCIVYAQREAPEHAHDVASKRWQRMAEAAALPSDSEPGSQSPYHTTMSRLCRRYAP